MPKVCLYFQIHQPFRLRKIKLTELGKDTGYFEEGSQDRNSEILRKVADKSYSPMMHLLLELLNEEERFCFSASVTGTAVDQMKKHRPDLITLLQEISGSGRMEFLGETYFHSLASLFSPTEFLEQVSEHKKLICDTFFQEPKIFRNTELIYSNKIAEIVGDMGFNGMLAEGADRVLLGRKPTRVYRSPGGLPLLLKQYKLSDDIAFRFSQSHRSDKPLTAETFCHWINTSFDKNEVINLFMDFETFGEHQWEDTGIFEFFRQFVKQFILSGGEFVMVSQAINNNFPVDYFDSNEPVSWADVDRDVTAWMGNHLQMDSLTKLYSLEDKVKNSGDDRIIGDWRYLQTSDHFYYMCTKWANDGDVHAYFSPYQSPYLAYTNFGFALADLNLRLKKYYG